MTIKARYDGRVFVPKGPVSLAPGTLVEIALSSIPGAPNTDEPPDHTTTLLADLPRMAEELPQNPDWPSDGAARHDHYLY